MNQKMNLERIAAYIDTMDEKSQIHTLDAIAWTVVRDAKRDAKRDKPITELTT